MLPAAVGALELPDRLTADPAGPVRVASVIDGDTLALDDGRRIRLVGIQALEIDRTDQRLTDPLAFAARDALIDLVAGQEITLAYSENPRDRFGRVLAHVFLADGTWVQQALLDAGLVHVYSFADNRVAVPQLLGFERAARAARRGLWQTRQAIDHRVAGAAVGSYAWVEGTVAATAVVRGRGFLNFGENFRTDFTISVSPGDLSLFGSLGDYRGRRVRVRGWLQSFNGPMIEVTHPEQIEVLFQ